MLVCFARAAGRFAVGGREGGRGGASCGRVEAAAVGLHCCDCVLRRSLCCERFEMFPHNRHFGNKLIDKVSRRRQALRQDNRNSSIPYFDFSETLDLSCFGR